MQSNPAEIQKHLEGINYPCTKEELISSVREAGAPDGVLDDLEMIPPKSYESPADVMEELSSEDASEEA